MSNASLAVKPNNQTPYDISDDELAKVKEWLFKLRPQIGVFSEQNQGLVNALINEDAWVTPDRRHGDHPDRRRPQELRLDRAGRRQHPLERGRRALRRQQEQGAGAEVDRIHERPPRPVRAGLHQGLQGARAQHEGHQVLERGTDQADELRARSQASGTDAGRDPDRQERAARPAGQAAGQGRGSRSTTSSRPARADGKRAGGCRPRHLPIRELSPVCV